MSEPIRIYIGTDRSQELALRVLDRSIRKRTQRWVETHSLVGLELPDAPDPLHRSRTGFSFARFAIPELAGRNGRAIYLDADMLVRGDIEGLWSLPMGGRKLLCQEDLPDEMASTAPTPNTRRKKQCSVMLLDCFGLDWSVQEIVSGLGPRYTYDELMSEMCVLDEDEVGYDIPVAWNSLEHLDADTCLIHYTDMMTQPWVYANNKHGWAWVDELREMIDAGELDASFVDAEIADGFARPSLRLELVEQGAGQRDPAQLAALARVDKAAGFIGHAALARRKPLTARIIGGLKRGLNSLPRGT